MGNFSAAEVKKLRDLTGAGMMDCKKALEETDGDYDAAVEALRIKGAAKAAKRGAEREATNGLVAAADGAMIELNCETDFVAKNDDFKTLADAIVTAAAANKTADVETLMNTAMADGRTVAAGIEALNAIIGEKIEIGNVIVLDGTVTAYMHQRSADLPAQVGVLVAFDGDEAVARATAMQLAAMRPQYVNREDIPAEAVESERRIAEATAREEGKPEAALEKIVEGRINGFYKEVVLLEQSSVQDSKKTVRAVLTEANTTVSRFARFEVGA